MQKTIKEQIGEYLEQEELYGNPRICEIGVSFRTYNCLRRVGMNNLGDLIGKSVQDLADIKNLGRKGVDEILKLVEIYGLKVEYDAKTKKAVITGTISDEKLEAEKNAKQIYMTKIDDVGFNNKTLGYLPGFITLEDLLNDNTFIRRMACDHKDVFQDILNKTAKYGFSLNKTGFLVLTALGKENNVLIKTLKENGLKKTLDLCDKKHFAKNSSSMNKISRDVEKYLNWLVEQKLINAKKEDFENVEKDIAQIRECFKKYVENQRMLSDIEKAKKELSAKIAFKNAEVRRYHHKANQVRQEGHNHNQFINFNIGI